ncbi:hypothetical protein J2S24_001908 [Thermoanaerobacter pentosaceus]|uniref:Uncharacterized protein n=1 Tax=Thermoanaerobacter pentosaceus TaxID=694059 RepID=A0ABT9M5L3_9THEO|nr:hypothetical protein [Thermoanaerobacter pentosaceus]
MLQLVDKLSKRRYFAFGATCDKALTKLSETEGGGRAEATDGGGGHLKAWMPIVPGTMAGARRSSLVLSLWNSGATMQNIFFRKF